MSQNAASPASQRMPAATRQSAPVCCYCDADLSCGACGMEQPYTDISVAKAEIESLKARNGELEELVDQAVYVINDARSGYVAGSRYDEQWDELKRRFYNSHAALQQPKPDEGKT